MRSDLTSRIIETLVAVVESYKLNERVNGYMIEPGKIISVVAQYEEILFETGTMIRNVVGHTITFKGDFTQEEREFYLKNMAEYITR
jgi:hypothetical protein